MSGSNSCSADEGATALTEEEYSLVGLCPCFFCMLFEAEDIKVKEKTQTGSK